MLHRRRPRSRGRRPFALAVILAVTILTGLPGVILGQGGFEIIPIDLGRFGINTLQSIDPSLYYRPFDSTTPRAGAAALGMGGAYLAMAEGAGSVAWSPAGLTSLAGVEIVADGIQRQSSGSTENIPLALNIPGQPPLFITAYASDLKSNLRYGMLSVATPLWQSGERKLVGAFSWRRSSDTAVPEETVQDLVVEEFGGFPVIISIDRTETGAVDAYGPSLAFQPFSGLSIGGNVNILTGRLRMTTEANVNTGGGAQTSPGNSRFTLEYQGTSFDLGAKLALGDKLHLAGRFTPAYTLEVTGGVYSALSLAPPGFPSTDVRGQLAGYDMEIPSSIGLGAAFHPFDRLWLAVDYNSQKMDETELRYNGPEPDFLDPDPLFEFLRPEVEINRDPMLPLADMTSIHVGLEFLLFETDWAKIPVRFGFRTVPLGYREINAEDYFYVYSYELDPSIEEIQTLGVVFTGLPTGDELEGDAISFGTSFQMGSLTYDFGADVLDYSFPRFYQDSPWDPVFNPNPVEGAQRPRDELGNLLPTTQIHPNLIKVNRTITTMRFSATYAF